MTINMKCIIYSKEFSQIRPYGSANTILNLDKSLHADSAVGRGGRLGFFP